MSGTVLQKTCNENIVVFIGPSGSGKTTAVRFLSGLQKTDSLPTTEFQIYEKFTNDQKIVLLDTPALKSNDTLTDISNCVARYNAIINSRSVVLVLVLAYETISLMRGLVFRELLENIGAMCPLFELKKHLYIYFSNVPNDVSSTRLKDDVAAIIACESAANSSTVIGLIDFITDSLEEEDGRVVILDQLQKKKRQTLDSQLGRMVKFHALLEPAKYYKCSISAVDDIKLKNMILSEISNIVSMLNTNSYDIQSFKNIGALLEVAPNSGVQIAKSLILSHIQKEMDSILLDFSLAIERNNPSSQKARINRFRQMTETLPPNIVDCYLVGCFDEMLLATVLKYLSEDNLKSMQEIYVNYQFLPRVVENISSKVAEWAAERTKLSSLNAKNVTIFWQSVTFLSSVSWLPIEKTQWISDLIGNIAKQCEENIDDMLLSLDLTALVERLQEPFVILEQIKSIPNYQQEIDPWLMHETGVKVEEILKRAFMNELQKIDVELISRITNIHHIKQPLLLLSAFAKVNAAFGRKFTKLTRDLTKKINSFIDVLLLEMEKCSPDWLEIEKQMKDLEKLQWLDEIGISISFRVQDIVSNLDDMLAKREKQIKLQWRDETTRHLVIETLESIEALQLIDSQKEKINQLFAWIVEQIKNYESNITSQLKNSEITIVSATEAFHRTLVHQKILATISSQVVSNLGLQLTDYLDEASETMLLQLSKAGELTYTSACKILDSLLYLKNAIASYELKYAEAVDMVSKHLTRQEGKIIQQTSLAEMELLVEQYSTALVLQKHIPGMQEKNLWYQSYCLNKLETAEKAFIKDFENSNFDSALSKLKQLPERFIPGKKAALGDDLTKRLNSIKITCDILPAERFLKQLDDIIMFLRHFSNYLELAREKYISYIELDVDNRLSCELTNLNNMLSKLQLVSWYKSYESIKLLHEDLISHTGKYKFTLPLTSMRLADSDMFESLTELYQNLLRCEEITKVNELHTTIVNAGNDLLPLKAKTVKIIRAYYEDQTQLNQKNVQELVRLSKERELLDCEIFPQNSSLGKAPAIKSLGSIFATIVSTKK